MLVFYNDNKASFQQFVQMMRTERDRQCKQDELLFDLSRGEVAATEDVQQQEQTTTEETTKETGDEDNSHGALR